MTIVVQPARTPAEHAQLAALARLIWHAHYPGIISAAQIDYMLAQGYSQTALAAQQAAGTRFVLAWQHDRAVGFGGASADPADPAAAWLDKLYVHADVRARGAARRLVADLREHVRAAGADHWRLRVNRHNAGAIAAYKRLGFVIERADIKPIGRGFVMDDYVMRQTLREN